MAGKIAYNSFDFNFLDTISTNFLSNQVPNLSKKPSHLPKLLAVGITLAVVSLLVATKPQPEVVMQKAVIQTVEAYQVVRQDTRPFESITGRLEPVRKTALHFEVEGIVLQKFAKPGQQVKQGQLLMVLEDDDLADRLAEAEALLMQESATKERDRKLLDLAMKNVELARKELDRLINLGKKSMASQSVLDNARQQLAQLESEKANLQYTIDTADQRYRIRRSQRELAERNLSRARLTAPYDGRVNAVYSEIGDRVTPGTRAVDFIDDSKFEIRLHVSRPAVSELAEGMPVEVQIQEHSFQGTVAEFQRDPDAQTFTYEIRIELAGQGFLSGTLARVDLPLRPALNALVVPSSAVLQDDGATSVFVINANKLEKRPVKLGIRYGKFQVVSENLKAGDKIVARDVSSLADQQQVTVQK